jgi:hypothetical protein
MTFRPVRLEIEFALAATEQLRSQLDLPYSGTFPEEIQVLSKKIFDCDQALRQARAEIDHFPIRQIDHALDSLVGYIFHVADNLLHAYQTIPLHPNASQEIRIQAAKQIRELFPLGLKEITHLAYIEEWEAVQKLLDTISSEPELLQSFSILGLLPDLDMLKRLHELYGQALGVIKQDGTSNKTHLLFEWYEYYRELMILAMYHAREQPELSERICTPYEEQILIQEKVRSYAESKD